MLLSRACGLTKWDSAILHQKQHKIELNDLLIMIYKHTNAYVHCWLSLFYPPSIHLKSE